MPDPELASQAAAVLEAVEEFSIPGPDEAIDVRLYLSDRSTPPLVVFYHGGGWVLGASTPTRVTPRL